MRHSLLSYKARVRIVKESEFLILGIIFKKRINRIEPKMLYSDPIINST